MANKDKIWVNQTCMAEVLLKAFAVKISMLPFFPVCIYSVFLESYTLHFIITDLRNLRTIYLSCIFGSWCYMHKESRYKGRGEGMSMCVCVYTHVFVHIISTHDIHMQNTKKILLYFQTIAHYRTFNRALILSHFME